MQRSFILAGAVAAMVFAALAQSGSGPYKVLRTVKVGGAGGYDYVYADVDGRRLYIPRPGAADVARISVFDLDSLAPVGEIPEGQCARRGRRSQVASWLREQQTGGDVGYQDAGGHQDD